MKKRVFGKKLDRSKSAKKALFRALTRALVIHGKIETTQAKAKALQPFVEKIIVLAKKGGLNERRRVYAMLANDRQTTNNIFDKVISAFTDINSGFTRAINLPVRRGDRAKMVRLEWSREMLVDKKKKKGKEKEKGKTEVKRASKTRRTKRRKS